MISMPITEDLVSDIINHARSVYDFALEHYCQLSYAGTKCVDTHSCCPSANGSHKQLFVNNQSINSVDVPYHSS